MAAPMPTHRYATFLRASTKIATVSASSLGLSCGLTDLLSTGLSAGPLILLYVLSQDSSCTQIQQKVWTQ